MSEQALRESKHRYERAFAAAEDGILLVHHEGGTIVDVNRRITAMLGYAKQELVGRRIWEIGVFDGVVASKQAFIELKSHGGRRRERLTLQTRDGALLEVDFVIHIDTSDKAPIIHCYVSDTAERKRTEAALAESESRLRSFIEHTSDVVMAVDVQGVIHFISPAVRTISGFEPAELLGRNFLDYVHPSDRAQAARELAELLARPEIVQRAERRYGNRNGSWKNLESVARNLLSVPGVNGIVVTLRDVTEHRKSEEQLRLASLLIERSPVVLLRTQTSSGWPVVYASENVRQWGHPAGELVARGESFAAFIHPDDLQRITDETDRYLAAGAETFSQEYRIVTRAGEPRWVEDYTTVERDAGGNAVFFQGIVTDINSRKLNELALKERALRIEAQSKALNEVSASMAVAAGSVESLAREVTERASKVTGVERANVWLFNDTETELRCIDLFEATPARHSSGMRLTEDMFGNEFAALKSAPYVNADDPLSDPRTAGYVEPYLKPLRITSMLDAVIQVSDRHLGLLCLEYVDRAHHWESDEIEFACRLADKIGLTIANRAALQAQEQLRASLEETICAIANTIEVRDPYTAGHQRSVAELAAAIASEVGLSEERIHGLKLAATIHDLGKVQVPAEILNKPGKLTAIEYQLIQTHAQAGYDIIKHVTFPWPIAEMILQHHERLDGSGYPRGLKSDQMLPEAKILAVADVVESMVSHRPYRAALGAEAALAEIIRGRDSLFDAEAVDACVKLVREKRCRLSV